MSEQAIAKIGETYLITTDNWFFAPDGNNYKAVFGTVKSVQNDMDTLGIKTNAKSTNWYIAIGNMLIAGCQIHYAIKTTTCSKAQSVSEVEHKGNMYSNLVGSRIYFADEE